ncbi:MAG: TonB-dependent receptor [Balneolaceae bacterium]|nr:TonB-dependent receptor [Balneolaceae bacterium]
MELQSIGYVNKWFLKQLVKVVLTSLPLIIAINSSWAQSKVYAESYSAYDQIKPESKLLNIASFDFNQAPALDALSEVASVADYRLNYNRSRLNTEVLITQRYEVMSVIDILEDISKQANFIIHFTESGQIILTSGSDDPENEPETITGKVTDEESGEPIPGVNIFIEGTTIGTVSDLEGNFELTVPDPNATLVFTYIGYERLIVNLDGRSELDVSLRLDIITGEELIVVGYGTQRKSDISGSVATVNVESAVSLPTTNFAEMIRGEAAGVQVSTVSARPGGTSDIIIRGENSLRGGNEPLMIVDGIPVSNINDIQSADIESIEILKDASAQAIYGARAANGVILVTTKRGSEGRFQVNYHGYTTTQRLTRNFELYSPLEFAQLRREAHRTINDGQYLNDEVIFNDFELQSIEDQQFVNWDNELINDAQLNSHSISVSGGGESTRIYSSANFYDQSGILPTSGYKRGTFRLNLDQTITDKFSLQANVNFLTDVQDIESGGINYITISPLARPFDENNELNKFPLGGGNLTVNPLWNIRESENTVKANNLTLNVVGDYNFTENFSYRLNSFINRTTRDQGTYITSIHGSGVVPQGRGTVFDSLREEWQIENIINYSPEFGQDHRLDLTFVQSLSATDYFETNTIGTQFPNDILGYNGISLALNQQINRNGNERRISSLMGRAIYDLYDKYVFTFTGRYDGSSVFAENNKWAFFPAASFAWKAQNEPFLSDVDLINELKFRVSYGSVGNQALDPYTTLGNVQQYPYVFGGSTVGGNLPGGVLPNPNLTWETSTTLNAGLDFGILGNTFVGGIDFYRTTTRDLLVDISLGGSTGYSSTITNGGRTQNQGVELFLRSNIIRNPTTSWSVSVAWATNSNEILSTGLFDDDGNPLDDEGRLRFVGEPINVIWQYKFDGIFQSQSEIDESAQSDQPGIRPGNIRVVDKNGDGTIDEDDRFIFATDPDWFGSISSDFVYRNFELFANVYFVQGATRSNPYLAQFETGGSFQGILNGIKVPYFTPENPSNKWPIPQAETQSYLFALAVQDASYIRLRTLTMAYNLPADWISRFGANNLRVYFTGHNLLTLTSYKSYSPEINPGGFPEAKAFTFGVNLGF